MTAPRLKRVYEAPTAGDGMRVLVDRLWPRGLSKDAAKVDLWLKEVAPSDALRREFHAHPERFEAFRAAYAAELEGSEALARLRSLARAQPVTLLYAARDEAHNNAVVLRELVAR
ncbi:MAG TPA: DUF488 family protein [Luteimonas sp.]|nr:DUF488 family protein [Luteimonas sp.]